MGRNQLRNSFQNSLIGGGGENEMKIENINGHLIECGSSAIIQNSTKTLNIDIDRKLFVYMDN